MAITPVEGMLIRVLINIAITEITNKVQKMTPEEQNTATLEAEAKSAELMQEVDSH